MPGRPYSVAEDATRTAIDAGLLIREAAMSSGATVPEVSEDGQLVAAVRNGDPAAFGRLYERHARMIHGVLLAHVPYSDVDDLVQDVFLAAFRKLASLREPAAFACWLLVIARNRANDFHRHSRAPDELLEDIPDSRDKGDREAHAALEAIRSLPEAYRETL